MKTLSSALRALAEQAGHRLVVRRHLPPPFERVSFYTSPEGGLRYLRPSLAGVDPTLLSLVTELVVPGSVVWDIGANVGLFTFASAAASGPRGLVVAVEPDTWLVDLLRRSARLRGDLAPVTVVPAAAGAAAGLQRFHLARRNRATNYLDGYGTTQTGGSREAQVVPVMAIDGLAEVSPWPDVVKIDVEGAELLALGGATETLRHRPVVICEVAGENSAEVHARLTALGYRVQDGSLAAPERTDLGQAPPQTLALPQQRYREESSAAK